MLPIPGIPELLKIHDIDIDKISPINQIDKINAPILIIQGDRDTLVTAEDAKLLYEKARKPKKLWIVEGADHARSYIKKKEEYEKRVLEFFGRYL